MADDDVDDEGGKGRREGWMDEGMEGEKSGEMDGGEKTT